MTEVESDGSRKRAESMNLGTLHWCFSTLLRTVVLVLDASSSCCTSMLYFDRQDDL